jgi:hypothetical protein
MGIRVGTAAGAHPPRVLDVPERLLGIADEVIK